MANQRCEGLVSQLLKQLPVWYLKLQVMPLAHQKMPADFLVLHNEQHNRMLIECKQITIPPEANKMKARFSFDRLSQELALERFEKVAKNNASFVCLLFWHKNQKNSDMYFMTLKAYKEMKEFQQSFGYSSMSLQDITDCYENEDDHGILRWTNTMDLETLDGFLVSYITGHTRI